MRYLAVIDTNVIVSAFISKNKLSPPSIIVKETLDGMIVPILNDSILHEYRVVLLRPKFHLKKEDVESFLLRIKHYGLKVEPTPTDEEYPDPDDTVFYETAMSLREEGCLVVTGNTKHFPQKDFVVTPSEMIYRMNSAVKENISLSSLI